MGIFMGYVSLPEGNRIEIIGDFFFQEGMESLTAWDRKKLYPDDIETMEA